MSQHNSHCDSRGVSAQRAIPATPVKVGVEVFVVDPFAGAVRVIAGVTALTVNVLAALEPTLPAVSC